MSSTQQLLQTIDQLQQSNKKVTVTVLPSQVKRRRKSSIWLTQTKHIMTYSNLSRIKPKLRTQGNVTGNFGRPKSKAGSPLSDIGNSTKDVINITTRKEYINRMITAYHTTTDNKLKSFCYHELHRLHAIWLMTKQQINEAKMFLMFDQQQKQHRSTNQQKLSKRLSYKGFFKRPRWHSLQSMFVSLFWLHSTF